MIMKQYEKLLRFMINVYNVPKSHMVQLEPIFWQTFAAVTLVLYIENLLALFNVDKSLGIFVYAIYALLYLLVLLLTIPFQIQTIQITYGQEIKLKPIWASFMREMIVFKYTLKMVLVLLFVIGTGIVSFIPYLISYFLMQSSATSNIFTAYSSLLFLAGLIATLYIFIRTIGALAFPALGKDIGINAFFNLTYAHVIPIFMILVLASIPPLLVYLFIHFVLDNVVRVSNILVIQLVMGLIQSAVRTLFYLLVLYVAWVGLTQYMQQQ